jgi:hypothetical protein
MSGGVSAAWISLFFAGANLIAILAAVIGVFSAFACVMKFKDLLGRETRQHVRASTVIAYFLVGSIGLSFAGFANKANEGIYYGTGASFGKAGNPLTWRAENAPNLNKMKPELMITAVVLIGFTFLGALAFFLALNTMFRFDTLHPQHHGAYKDFLMYTVGGIVTTNIESTFRALSKGIPFLSSTADMLQQAAAAINWG